MLSRSVLRNGRHGLSSQVRMMSKAALVKSLAAEQKALADAVMGAQKKKAPSLN